MADKILGFYFSLFFRRMLELNYYSIFVGIARKLASSGYAVFAMDYPGFGLSEGLHGYIPKFDLIVDDVIEHYSKVKGMMLVYQLLDTMTSTISIRIYVVT